MRNNDNDIEARGMLLGKFKSFRLARRLQIISDFLNIGLAIAILLVLTATIHKIIFNTIHIPFQVFVLSPILLFILSLFKHANPKETALKIDNRLKMKERLTTSIDFLDKEEPYTALLFSDTIKKMNGVRPSDIFPIKFNRAISFSALLCMMLLFYNLHDFTKGEPTRTSGATLNVKSAIVKEAGQLKEVADNIETGSLAGDALNKEMIQKLKNLSEGLQAESIDKHDALLMLADASESIKGLYLKETGSPEELNIADTEAFIAEEKIADGIAETFNEILNSIESAKEHIAEADIELDRKPAGRESARGTSADNLLHGKPVSGLTPVTGYNASLSDAAISGSGPSENADASRHRDVPVHTKDLEFPAGNIILKYPDGVISLESLPKKYHKIVKDYFDAVSGGK